MTWPGAFFEDYMRVVRKYGYFSNEAEDAYYEWVDACGGTEGDRASNTARPFADHRPLEEIYPRPVGGE